METKAYIERGIARVLSEANPAERPELARKIRDYFLAESDWTQLVDVSLTEEQKEAWATYRQALRDITKQPGFPESIEWPSTPV